MKVTFQFSLALLIQHTTTTPIDPVRNLLNVRFCFKDIKYL